MKPVHLWIISDGKPGHLNQSLGLALALQRQLTDCSYEILNAKPLSGLFSGPPRGERAADLVIGAGHRTHLSVLLASKLGKAKSVVLMKPSLPLALFDLCLIPEHDGLFSSAKVVTTLGALNRMLPGEQRPGSGLVLLGGPSKHFEWDEQKLTSQLSQLFEQESSRHWQLVSSRRTPQNTLAQLAERFPQITCIDVSDTDADWLPSTLPTMEVCWVTEDSVSMVFEALTAGCSTGVLRVPSKGQSRVAKGIELLRRTQRVQQLEDDNFTAPAALAEADRCAAILIKRIL